MSEIAVSIKGVKKHFKLPHEREDSLKLKLLNSLRGKRNKGHDVYKALNGVDIEIKKGEFVGILGRNGAGKSTLLKIIAEIYKPSSGSIQVNGKLVPFIELGVGFNPNLSGRDNVYLNGAMLGFTPEEIDRMYDSIVEFAELEEFMDQKLKNYSSGMQVRLAFSVAIKAEADVLLLDEVLAVGDAAFQRKCYEYFDSLKESNKTIILVSHSLGVIRKYCDKGYLIEGGKAIFEGTGEEAANEYLSLFNQSKHTPDEKKSSDRPGDKRVIIEKVNVKIADDTIRITARIKNSDNPIKDVKFGFRIKDSNNRVLIGANNLNVEAGQSIDIESGGQRILEFTLPNILGNQKYRLSATLNSSADPQALYDSREDVVVIESSKDGVYYPLVAPAILRVSKGKD